MTATHTSRALYLEFRRDTHTSQILIVPSVLQDSGDKFFPAKIITRQVSKLNPRRSWRYYGFVSESKILPEELSGSTEAVEAYINSEIQPTMLELGPLFAGYQAGHWEMVAQPLSIEMSEDDIKDTTATNTPQALLRRVMKARAVAGFPEELFDATSGIKHERNEVRASIPSSWTSAVDGAVSQDTHEALSQCGAQLSAVLIATLTQGHIEGSRDILNQYSNKASAVRGRGATTKKAAVQKVEDPEGLTGEKEYVRPNGQKYITRKWGEHDDVAVLKAARENGIYPMLYGAPGTGKTALVEATFGEELITVLGSGDTEVADLVGGYVQNATGGFEWVDGPLLTAAEEGRPLLIDEIGLIDPKVLSIVYGLMDGRREYRVTANPERGVVKAHEAFTIVAATNPNAPGVRLSEALLSRFGLQVEVTTDWNIARKRGVSKLMVTAAQNLAKKQTSGEVSWAPQFRELEDFQRNEKLFGTSFAIANLLACAPEIDRAVVQDVLSRAYGESVLPARI